jgi:transposase
VRERQKYSKEFKAAIVSKIMNRGDSTVEEVCEAEGVNFRSASNWLLVRGSAPEMKKKTSSRKRSGEEKLKALIEAGALSEADLGAYLRREGLYTHNLEEWKSEFISIVNSSNKKKKVKDERDKKIKNLERDLLRKDKALAEASALLILQKKVNLIWGTDDEDEK